MADALLAAMTPVVTVDGRRSGVLARDLERLEVADSVRGLSTLRLHLNAGRPGQSDDVLEHLDGREVRIGSTVEVSVGPGGGERIVFRGTVSALEATFTEGDVPVVSLFAEDALMRLRMATRSRSYLRVTDGDVARWLAGQHHLRAEVLVDGPRHDHVQQLDDADLDFLRRRAALVGAEVWADGTTLHVASREHRRGTAVTLTQGVDLAAVAVRADLAHQVSAVSVSGYDARARGAVDVTVPGSAVDAETDVGGRTGPDALQQVFGELPARRTGDVPLRSDEARVAARSALLRLARRFVTVRGTTTGTPDLVVASRLTLRRCGRAFDGPGYYVTRVEHVFDLTHGLRTHFEAERPTVNRE